MSTLNFDANTVDPAVGFNPIPEGKYQAVITESEMKENKNKTGRYLKLTFEIIDDGEFKGRKVWAQLNLENPNADAIRIARAELSAVCRAVNVMTPKDSVELHNLPLVIDIRCRKDATTGDIRNEIKGYESRQSNARPSQPVGDKAPWAR